MTDKYNSRKQFITAAGNLWKPFMELTMAWEKLSQEDNGETGDNYPFQGSFDEWIYEYANWFDKIAEKFSLQIDDFEPTIAVKELKEILNVIDDDTQIVIKDEKNDWWLNIAEVQLPDEDDGNFTLTFYTKDNFDTRQF